MTNEHGKPSEFQLPLEMMAVMALNLKRFQ